jgi:hypothetical protein
LFGSFTGVVLLTVGLLPVAALVVWALARRRRATGSTSAWAWRLSLAEVGIVYGTVPWVWLTLLPGVQAGNVPGRVSLVPLRDLLTIAAAGPQTLVSQVVGNLLVFAALGFFAPVRFAAVASLPRILAFAASCSILIETAQYALRLDRVSSVDDVLLNTAGATLAALASRRWWRAGRGGSAAVTGLPAPGGDSDAVGHPQLLLNVGEVRLDGSGGDVERGADLGVRFALGHQRDDVEFPVGEGPRWFRGAPQGELPQQPDGHRRADQGVPGRGGPDGLDQQRRAGMLEQEA